MTDTHREAIEAAARAMAETDIDSRSGLDLLDALEGVMVEVPERAVSALTTASIRAFLAKVEVTEDMVCRGWYVAPEDGVHSDDLQPIFRAMLAQMREEIG